MKFTAAVYGLGNIGRCAIEALEIVPDFQCLGVIRRKESLGSKPNDLRGIPDFASFNDLINKAGKPDVVLIASPSRQVPDCAKQLLEQGVCTVDSFDIHDRIVEEAKKLDPIAKNNKVVGVISAGWDPGSDSILRALFEAMVPKGTTFTNFGRGRSMGHSAAVRSMDGVANATSITIPMGGGRHSRLVYVVLKKGASLEKVKETIKNDPYFIHDPLEVREVTEEQLDFVADASHGVLMERVGSSGLTANQHLTFDMRIDNPALTAQIMVSCARAAIRLKQQGIYGIQTMIDIPPVLMLPGERWENIGNLV